VAHTRLSLAVNGRERQLHRRLVPFQVTGAEPGNENGNRNGHGASTPVVAIVGLGYVGLPTALALHGQCQRIIGVDISQRRLDAIASRNADLSETDRARLAAALADRTLELTGDVTAISEAEAVIICVPTPVDDGRMPDLTALRGACSDVVRHARRGQTIILTSTTYAGTTREMLIEPLAERGLRAGSDVFVAFSPERIDPGNPDHPQRETPRVVGGATSACASRAAAVVGLLTRTVYLVSSPDAAEATKLYENVFRAVSLALANEFADACAALGLDPIEVTLAAGTKPFGFLGVFPGPGVGGHCIPCDPHYLLWQLAQSDRRSPLIEQAMASIGRRPERVVARAGEVLDQGLDLAGARVIVVGASYKSGVRDLRESPALTIIAGLRRRGAEVSLYDPLVPEVPQPGGPPLRSVAEPDGADYDLAVIHTRHPGVDYAWVADCPRVLDATYQFEDVPHRALV
jgi:UDP-N-acetyl-D-glucosamine dehydrogenase